MFELKLILFAYFLWIVLQRALHHLPLSLPDRLTGFLSCSFCSGFWLSLVSLGFASRFLGLKLDWVWASGIWALIALAFSHYEQRIYLGDEA
jgi:hypothetical protein